MSCNGRPKVSPYDEVSEFMLLIKKFKVKMHCKWNEKLTPTMVGADLWSPAVVGVNFFYNKPIDCNA